MQTLQSSRPMLALFSHTVLLLQDKQVNAW